MNKLLKFVAAGASAAALSVAASAASAAVVVNGYTLDTGSFGAQTGVHSAGAQSGQTVNGYVNKDGSAVTFSTSSGLLNLSVNGQGEATVLGDPLMENLTVTFAKAWDKVTFNLEAPQGAGGKFSSDLTLLVNGSVLFSLTPNPGDDVCTICVVDNGENKFTVWGPGITSLAFTFDPAIGSGKQFRVEGLSSAVPEPATWAMMIAGFGLAGATIRRRRAIPGLAA
ncbi:MAG TPA: PEPxxWA-CTERM sorting domain-containing protein [Phenylobacterium sp.]